LGQAAESERVKSEMAGAVVDGPCVCQASASSGTNWSLSPRSHPEYLPVAVPQPPADGSGSQLRRTNGCTEIRGVGGDPSLGRPGLRDRKGAGGACRHDRLAIGAAKAATSSIGRRAGVDWNPFPSQPSGRHPSRRDYRWTPLLTGFPDGHANSDPPLVPGGLILALQNHGYSAGKTSEISP
jgi:hypothetical protein